MVSLIIPVTKDHELQHTLHVDETIILAPKGAKIKAKEYVKVIEYKHFDHGATRNTAAKIARGEFLVFLTQDAKLKADTVIKLIEPMLNDKSIAMVYARQIPYDHHSLFTKIERDQLYPPVPLLRSWKDIERIGFKAVWCSSVCLAVRKKAFFEVGGFEESVIGTEDATLAYKLLQAGYYIFYNPEAQVIHSHDESLINNFRRSFDVGVFFSNHPKIYSLGRPEKFAVGILLKEISAILRAKRPSLIPNLVLIWLVRTIGFRLGFKYKVLPVSFRKILSLNRNFWQDTLRLSDGKAILSSPSPGGSDKLRS